MKNKNSHDINVKNETFEYKWNAYYYFVDDNLRFKTQYFVYFIIISINICRNLLFQQFFVSFPPFSKDPLVKTGDMNFVVLEHAPPSLLKVVTLQLWCFLCCFISTIQCFCDSLHIGCNSFSPIFNITNFF